MKKCAYCCNKNADSAARCEWCGMAVDPEPRASQTDLHCSPRMKNCSYCGREDEGSAAHCSECGTPFKSKPSRSQVDPVSAAKNQMISGAFLCIGGIAVTTLTFVSAVNSPSGGIYVITWGAIIFGAERFFKGYFQYYFETWRSKKRKPSEALDEGVRAESGVN